MKLTDAQIRALKMVERRNWPAGQPRLGWLNKATARVLLAKGLISERSGTVSHTSWERTQIVDLTDAGRAALEQG